MEAEKSGCSCPHLSASGLRANLRSQKDTLNSLSVFPEGGSCVEVQRSWISFSRAEAQRPQSWNFTNLPTELAATRDARSSIGRSELLLGDDVICGCSSTIDNSSCA